MTGNQDNDWDIQQAYQDDPKKAIFYLSSLLLHPDKFAAKVVNAINSQSPLQDALKANQIKNLDKCPDTYAAICAAISKERKDFWYRLIINKTTAIGTAIILAVCFGVANINTIVPFLIRMTTK